MTHSDTLHLPLHRGPVASLEAIYIFPKFDTSTPGSATMYTGVDVQLLTHLVVDMQLLPGMDVSSLTGVDVKHLARVNTKQRTCVCAREPTNR